MMLTLIDGRKKLYQWDTGRTASVSVECDTVHFANLKYGSSMPVVVENGTVNIPNELLTSGERVYCWAFVTDENGAYTKQEAVFDVIKRPKPSEYVYTPSDVLTIESAVEKALQEAKENGDFKGDKGSDATVTTESVVSALGYTPANQKDVDNILSGIDDVPEFVKTEAEAVIDKVIAAQGGRTFTFAAISDAHYGNNGYTDGILHACQAIKYIDKRIKLDAVAVLGDYTDGYTSSNIANAMVDFKAVNAVLDQLRFALNIRQQGNHDYYENNIPITRRLIQAYSDNAEWGSRTGGYFFKDFDDYKLRIVCPNANENNPTDASTNNPTSAISMTDEQVKWFVSAIDISDKEDAEKWQILILSHQPLDYWTSDNKYRLSYIVNAYQRGESWSDGVVSCDYAGKNKATLVGNIHGHLHNFLTDTIYLGNSNNTEKTKVYRMSTPNACYGRENEYGGAWGESASYPKTKSTAKDTAFVIYCINLDTYKINAICYGAGYDRILNYISEKEPEIYTVTNNLTYVETNNTAEQITEGGVYSAALTPTGSRITSVTVLMSGVDITDMAYSNGIVIISPVTGNISITAVGEKPLLYTNQVPLSVGSDGKPFNNGLGYITGYRLNSSGAVAAESAANLTGFIPAKAGDTIYIKNMTWRPGVSADSICYVYTYKSDFTKIEGGQSTNIDVNLTTSYTTDNGQLVSVTLDGSTATIPRDLSDTAYIRISYRPVEELEPIVTVNQPIIN